MWIIGVFVNVSALKIHISENARNAVTAFPEFITEYRGYIAVKVEISLLYICETHHMILVVMAPIGLFPC